MKTTATILLSAAVILVAFSAAGAQVSTVENSVAASVPAVDGPNIIFTVDTHSYLFAWTGDTAFGSWNVTPEKAPVMDTMQTFFEAKNQKQIGFASSILYQYQNITFRGMHNGISLWQSNPKMPSSTQPLYDNVTVTVYSYVLFNGPDPQEDEFLGGLIYGWINVPQQDMNEELWDDVPYAVFDQSTQSYLLAVMTAYNSPYLLDDSQVQALSEAVPLLLSDIGPAFNTLSLNSPIGANNFQF